MRIEMPSMSRDRTAPNDCKPPVRPDRAPFVSVRKRAKVRLSYEARVRLFLRLKRLFLADVYQYLEQAHGAMQNRRLRLP
ncbi:hypothetical protein [Hyphomicrobium sp.]|uniref:hypothetical protein n=1 Tax=Hyphomicrobium sp. TaxID=82 RepID=UPI002FE37B68